MPLSGLLLALLPVALLAFWLGEARGGIEGLADGSIGAILVAISAGAWRAPIGRRIGLGLLAALLWMLPFLAGQQSRAGAFNRCLEDGEATRLKLAAYHAQHREYPPELAQLAGELPCKPLLRPSLLAYRKTAEGYDMHFGDYFVTYSANEAHGFEARK